MFGRLLEALKMAFESFTSILFVSIALMLFSFLIVFATSRAVFLFLMASLGCWSSYTYSIVFGGVEMDLLTFGILSGVCAQSIYFYRQKDETRRMDSF